MRRHDFDALSFAFGLLFAGVGIVLLATTSIPQGLDLPWAGPLIAIGVAILLVVAAPRTERASAADARPTDETAGEPPA